ncbi:DUF2185 domain-containing protein [Gallaecimonas xiamenensis]|uniref:Immunity protein Imm33 domain-containing protein n=1 Tax=Gallaecimonas xiamenensis 3-C-1 TaxID=745411 RepID=K2IY32_9GAMM|nr:DUF2185 domain-containing protein [Gallaecimonas xiamenensis]EKE67532.1 hypothetical protein B3C1_18507 [Gallaecimonas xiamenensis 3-C-1]
MNKPYRLAPEQLSRLIPELGYGFVTDKVTVDGQAVDYMVRQEPENDDDSGWVFYGGGETQAYLDNPDNTSVLSLNTVANYDPAIIPFLTYPPGTEIERQPDGRLQVVSGHTERPQVILQPPVGPGWVDIAGRWTFDSSELLLRRLDGNSLVLWRPGLTFWISLYGASTADCEGRMAALLAQTSPMKTDLEQRVADRHCQAAYRLQEEVDGKSQCGTYLFGFAEGGDIHLAIYQDDDTHQASVRRVWDTLRYQGA